MISIIIPTFNRQDFIIETMHSVIDQTYTDWECIIVDDGSTDDTEVLVKKYTAADPRFHFYKRPTTMLKGANSCRNFGFSKSKGEYIKFLDSDDLLTSDCLQKQSDILDVNPDKQVCLSYAQYFNYTPDNKKEFWSRNNDYSDYLLGHITNQIRWQTADPLWRKSFFLQPPFKEGIMNSQEWLMHGESLLKLNRNQIYNLKETFTLTRRGHDRISVHNKASNHFKNQKLTRILLLQEMIRTRKFKVAYGLPLIKQIIAFSYWEWKKK